MIAKAKLGVSLPTAKYGTHDAEFTMPELECFWRFSALGSPTRCRTEQKQVTYQKVFLSQTITGTGTPGFFL